MLKTFYFTSAATILTICGVVFTWVMVGVFTNTILEWSYGGTIIGLALLCGYLLEVQKEDHEALWAPLRDTRQ